MSSIPRRTFSELTFLYSRHPDRNDIYVEGPYDAGIIKWFAEKNNLTKVAVYCIDSIEISEGALTSEGFHTGNNDRVRYLSGKLVGMGASRACCVVDADYARLLAIPFPLPPLYETDYSCMEMYLYSQACFSKLFTLGCNQTNCPIEDILTTIANPLQEIFLYRCANEQLGWKMDWLDNIPCLILKHWSVIIDNNEYIVRLLNKNGRIAEKEQFVSKISELRLRLRPDPRYQIHGHDFTLFLSWYLKKKRIGVDNSAEKIVRRMLTLSIDLDQLRTENLFLQISARFCG